MPLESYAVIPFRKSYLSPTLTTGTGLAISILALSYIVSVAVSLSIPRLGSLNEYVRLYSLDGSTYVIDDKG